MRLGSVNTFQSKQLNMRALAGSLTAAYVVNEIQANATSILFFLLTLCRSQQHKPVADPPCLLSFKLPTGEYIRRPIWTEILLVAVNPQEPEWIAGTADSGTLPGSVKFLLLQRQQLRMRNDALEWTETATAHDSSKLLKKYFLKSYILLFNWDIFLLLATLCV